VGLASIARFAGFGAVLRSLPQAYAVGLASIARFAGFGAVLPLLSQAYAVGLASVARFAGYGSVLCPCSWTPFPASLPSISFSFVLDPIAGPLVQ
jgi:hypothetical protein